MPWLKSYKLREFRLNLYFSKTIVAFNSIRTLLNKECRKHSKTVANFANCAGGAEVADCAERPCLTASIQQTNQS